MGCKSHSSLRSSDYCLSKLFFFSTTSSYLLFSPREYSVYIMFFSSPFAVLAIIKRIHSKRHRNSSVAQPFFCRLLSIQFIYSDCNRNEFFFGNSFPHKSFVIGACDDLFHWIQQETKKQSKGTGFEVQTSTVHFELITCF